MTEDDLRAVNGLVARCKNLEGELLRTRQVSKGDALYIELDRLRWRLRTEHGVVLKAFAGKAVPTGSETA